MLGANAIRIWAQINNQNAIEIQRYKSWGAGVSLKSENWENFEKFEKFKPLISKTVQFFAHLATLVVVTKPVGETLTSHLHHRILQNPSQFGESTRQ